MNKTNTRYDKPHYRPKEKKENIDKLCLTNRENKRYYQIMRRHALKFKEGCYEV